MPGQAADTRALQLQISASSELLIRNLKQADQAVATFTQSSERRLTVMDQAFARAGTSARGLVAGLVAGASVGSLIELTKRGLEYASSLDEVAQQIGVTSRDLQVYRYAATQVGISQEEMDKGLQKFTRSLGEARAGSAAAVGVFKQLGFSDADIKKLDHHDAFLKTADGIARIGDRATRAVPEVALLGKAGQQLDTLLSGGSAAINELARAAEELGIVLSRDQIEHADRAADKLSALKKVLEARIAVTVAENADAIYDLAEAFAHAASKAGLLISNLRVYLAQSRLNSANAQASMDEKNGARPERLRADYKAIQTAAADVKEAASARLPKPASSTDREKARGGGSYRDPAAAAAAERSAAAAAAKAEADRKKEVERQKRVADEGARLDDAWLSAQSQITADAVEQASIARDRLGRDTAAKLDDVDSGVSSGQIKAIEAAGLRARINRNAAIEADAINQRENVQLEREAQDLAAARLDDLRDVAGSDAALATTARERREIALRVLAAEKAAERARLQVIADDAVRLPAERRHSQGEIDVAQQGLSTLDQRYGGRQSETLKNNAGPLESYRDQLQRAVGDTNEALEGLEVDAFRHLEDGILGVIDGTESVAGAFKKMAASIIADLARIEIERAILGAVGGSVGGTGGGILSSLGSFLTGRRAGGGPVSGSGLYLVGEKGPELFAPGASGSIIPNSALRTPQVGSLAGMGGGGTIEHRVVIEPNADFNARVMTIAGGAALHIAPAVVDAAEKRVTSGLSRRRLAGGWTG